MRKNEFKEFEKLFPVVRIEEVSLKDAFLQYYPKDPIEERVKKHIIMAKEIGMRNFRKAAMDPSFLNDGEKITYGVGKKQQQESHHCGGMKMLQNLCRKKIAG